MATQLAAQRPIEVGDIAPGFRLAARGGETFDPGADHIAGKPMLLLFRPAGGALPGEVTALGARVRGMGGRCLVIGGDASDVPAGWDVATDPEGKTAAGYGLAGQVQAVLLAPNRHVAAVGTDVVALAAALDRIAARHGSIATHPPILILPDVFSRHDCQRLINVFAMQGQTFLEPGHGAPPADIGDYKMRIPEYGRKDRIDHWIMQADTNAFIDDRLRRRLFPEVLKCFQYRITRREGYRIGCYEGERGGELHGHRDNTKPNVAHRRFACSINLNTEQFEGGGIRFPEFGDQDYRPETGAAIVFSSSLLHEPLHVVKGKRFVLLAFIYGDH